MMKFLGDKFSKFNAFMSKQNLLVKTLVGGVYIGSSIALVTVGVMTLAGSAAISIPAILATSFITGMGFAYVDCRPKSGTSPAAVNREGAAPAVAADNAATALQIKSPAADFITAVENKGADAGVKTAALAAKPVEPKV